ncbi:MAG TPA: alpha/beta fold hydrolase, partial [Terrimesophilobacter sp.]|nr:alpha/beta fold hydrolase [Terrimesophilobacter sp.]
MSGDVRSFEHDGTIMIYTVSGAATGASFVLVHGIGMGRRVFTELAEKLAPQGRVYAIDLPGFGDSPEPASALSMSASGDFLAEFIRSIPNTKPTLVGHSMGTQVVVEAVA